MERVLKVFIASMGATLGYGLGILINQVMLIQDFFDNSLYNNIAAILINILLILHSASGKIHWI